MTASMHLRPTEATGQPTHASQTGRRARAGDCNRVSLCTRRIGFPLMIAHASAQGTPFACCYGELRMALGLCDQMWRGITTFAELQGCWALANAHFSNTTVVGMYNLTAAEKYSIFVAVIDESAHEIAGGPNSPPLSLDADAIPDGAVPELGYLPFEMKLSLPRSRARMGCPKFILRDVSIVFTLHHGRPRNATRSYAPMTFSISGCGRDAQSLTNLSFAALGYANLQACPRNPHPRHISALLSRLQHWKPTSPGDGTTAPDGCHLDSPCAQLSFVTLHDSHRIVSIEQPGGGGGGDALSFEESTLVNSTLHYFGDVTGSIGQAVGQTQNGSRAIGVRFLVANPVAHVTGFAHRPVGHRYQFGWYGTYPQEWRDSTRGFTHLTDTYVQYVYDLQLGSVNVSRTTFDGWWSRANPTFARWAINSTALPPSVALYNMETSRTAGVRTTYGCNVSDSTIRYAWDVDILRSAVRNTSFRWAAESLGPFPAGWAKTPPVNPSFWINLLTYQTDAGFVQSVNNSFICMRPSVIVAGGTAVREQVQTVANGSVLFRTPFQHTTDLACTPSERQTEFSKIRDEMPQNVQV